MQDCTIKQQSIHNHIPKKLKLPLPKLAPDEMNFVSANALLNYSFALDAMYVDFFTNMDYNQS